MKAIEFLKQNRVYEDETIYNSVGEIVGTISQLMEEYAALRQPPVSGRSEQCNHVFQRVERGGEFQGNQCECGEWEDLT